MIKKEWLKIFIAKPIYSTNQHSMFIDAPCSFKSQKRKSSCAYSSLMKQHERHGWTLFSMHSVNRLDDKLYSDSWFRPEAGFSFDCKSPITGDLRCSYYLRPEILGNISARLWHHTLLIINELTFYELMLTLISYLINILSRPTVNI